MIIFHVCTYSSGYFQQQLGPTLWCARFQTKEEEFSSSVQDMRFASPLRLIAWYMGANCAI